MAGLRGDLPGPLHIRHRCDHRRRPGELRDGHVQSCIGEAERRGRAGGGQHLQQVSKVHTRGRVDRLLGGHLCRTRLEHCLHRQGVANVGCQSSVVWRAEGLCVRPIRHERAAAASASRCDIPDLGEASQAVAQRHAGDPKSPRELSLGREPFALGHDPKLDDLPDAVHRRRRKIVVTYGSQDCVQCKARVDRSATAAPAAIGQRGGREHARRREAAGRHGSQSKRSAWATWATHNEGRTKGSRSRASNGAPKVRSAPCMIPRCNEQTTF